MFFIFRLTYDTTEKYYTIVGCIVSYSTQKKIIECLEVTKCANSSHSFPFIKPYMDIARFLESDQSGSFDKSTIKFNNGARNISVSAR